MSAHGASLGAGDGQISGSGGAERGCRPRRVGGRFGGMATLPQAVTATGTVARPEPPALRRVRRRRRPSGEPPPLPRHLNASGKWWLAAAAAVILVWIAVAVTGSVSLFDAADTWVLQAFAQVRSGPLTRVALIAGALATPIGVYVLWVANFAVLVVVRRWRHLFVWVGVALVVVNLGSTMLEVLQRPRPYEVELIGRWAGYSMPSLPITVLTAFLVCTLYSLVPAGRYRTIGQVGRSAACSRSPRSPASTWPRTTRPTSSPARSWASRSPRGLPMADPERRVPGDLPQGAHRAPRRHGRPGRGDRPGAAGPARPARHLGQAVQPGGLRRLHAAADRREVRRGRRRHLRVRQAVRGHPRPLRPVVQARPHPAVRPAGGRAAVPQRAAAGPVRGLRPAPDERRGAAGVPPARHRGDHPRAGVPAGHGVHHRLPGDRRGRGRRRDHRPGPGRRPPDVGDRAGPPRHQARQPAGARRAAGDHRHRVRRGAARARGGRRSTWPT